MFYVILTIHIALCIVLIGLVLLQQGKGADLGAAFGSGSSNTVFGAAGATAFITKLTTGIAISFMITTVMLINIYSAHSRSVAAGSNLQISSDPVKALVDKAKGPAPEGEVKGENGAAAPAPVAPAAEPVQAPK